MYKKALWIGLLTLILGCAVWFVLKASQDLYRYFQYTVQTKASVQAWDIQESSSGHYAVIAHYSYFFNDKTYEGKGQVGSLYPNPWAAQEAKNRFSRQIWHVWINPRSADHSLIEKHFPFKKVVSAALLLGVGIYFLILGVYLRKTRNG